MKRMRAKTITRPKATHLVPSGMGGSFAVHIVEREGDRSLVEVHYPTGDWGGVQFRIANSKLRPQC